MEPIRGKPLIEERIAHAKQSSNLEARNIQRPNKKLDADVLIALGVADASMLQAMTGANALDAREFKRRLTGFLANYKGISAKGIAEQVYFELMIDRCQHDSETARCVNGAWVPLGEWMGEPSAGWPDCPVCLGSGRAKADKGRRALSAGRDKYDHGTERVYTDALNWCAAQMMNEGRDVWRLLK